VRILLLTHSFNSLAQRLWVELERRGHEISIEFDINDQVALEAAALFAPELILAPFLKRRIPEALWRKHRCLVVHPGIVGDRGPSALDRAIMNGEANWGVTVLQATEVLDGGPVWASRDFPMRDASKASLYRNEVAQAAVAAVLEAIERYAGGGFEPMPPDYADPAVRGRPHAPMRREERRIDWLGEDADAVLRKLRAADSAPGVADEVLGLPVLLYHGVRETKLAGAAGEILATRHGAVLRATRDGAVWITHMKRRAAEPTLKLPAATVLGERLAGVPASPLPALPGLDPGTWQDIAYEEDGPVGLLHFPFYNGALARADCLRLTEAVRAARERPTEVLVLTGGPDFWCNGIHLNVIEAAASPADESWANIEAMDDLCLAILEADQLTVAALQGNAGAGGCFLALTCDRVWARRGVVLNPHYKGMGNLYGSEYWTYLLPRRVGAEAAQRITRNRLPIGAPEAAQSGLIDAAFGEDVPGFVAEARRRAASLASGPQTGELCREKRACRARDEAQKPLAQYRAEELERMRLNFYGFDPSYHVARYHFVHRLPHAWTPLHLARHRRDQWLRQVLLRTRGAA
jgi:putative two-component system hydrogenase maturation factor HypX/HoxX